MRVTIETFVAPSELKAFLVERDLKVPAFLDSEDCVVIWIDRRSPQAAFELITWLLDR